MSIHSMSSTSGRDTHLSRRRREQREDYQRLLNGPTRFAPQPKCDEKNLEEARKLLGITVRDKHKNSSVTKDDSYIVSKNDNARVPTQKIWRITKDCAKQKKRKKFL
jgi:hypothetical protein